MHKTLITAVAVLTLGVAPLIAQPAHPRARGEVFGPKNMRRLHLTDAQREQIVDMHRTFRSDNRDFFKSTREDVRAFREAKRAGDTAKMDEMKPRVEADRARLKQLREDFDQRVSTVLTPEQNEEWQRLRAERKARRQ